MAVTESPGASRALYLLNGIPDRFNDFCHMDQMTFIQLADWIVEHAHSNNSPEISVEESLFVFLDIVAQGNSFRTAAIDWEHDVKLTQSIFFSVLNALHILHEKEDISPSCPSITKSKSQWRVLKTWRPDRSRADGKLRIGDADGDGLLVSRESLEQALTALNNFIYHCRES
ncbi:hypothetical protein BDV95DRAFT_167628 [Massariosphaeria phaeospora]|uniref:DUF8040 domain-containing protein n=1 Tax=Massariosphaeria phaeospora TaxID=100035 RepID=A0A7C8I151_9PLEO|nr:hypothetical protein BDV95DRAFT_167628 [Massariosphaeria phaeospora]